MYVQFKNCASASILKKRKRKERRKEKKEKFRRDKET